MLTRAIGARIQNLVSHMGSAFLSVVFNHYAMEPVLLLPFEKKIPKVLLIIISTTNIIR